MSPRACSCTHMISCHVHTIVGSVCDRKCGVRKLYMALSTHPLIIAHGTGTPDHITYAPRIDSRTQPGRDGWSMEHMCEPHDRLSPSERQLGSLPTGSSAAAGIAAAAAASAVAATAPSRRSRRAARRRPPGWGAIGSTCRRRRRARHHRAAGRAGTAAAPRAPVAAGRQVGEPAGRSGRRRRGAAGP